MKLIIFDWDGTLVDSTARIVDCFERAAIDVDLKPSPRARQMIGLSLTSAAQQLYPDLSTTKQAQFVHAYRRWFVSDLPSSQLFATTYQTLEVLKAQGYWMAVATGKSRRGLNRELQAFGLQSFFFATRCADEAPSKPHPQMLHEILEELALEPKQAVMVGDTSFDLEMAKAARVPGIAALYGAHESSRLLQFDLLGALSDLSDLPKVLLKSY